MIGQSLRRLEDPQLLQGRGVFVDDARLPGALTLGIVRSPHPHARIRSIGTEAARRMQGVVDILTGVDTERVTMMFLQRSISELRQPRCTPLALDQGRYVGEPVAAVLATAPAIAADARDLIEVDYEPNPQYRGRGGRPEARRTPGARRTGHQRGIYGQLRSGGACCRSRLARCRSRLQIAAPFASDCRRPARTESLSGRVRTGERL